MMMTAMMMTTTVMMNVIMINSYNGNDDEDNDDMMMINGDEDDALQLRYLKWVLNKLINCLTFDYCALLSNAISSINFIQLSQIIETF